MSAITRRRWSDTDDAVLCRRYPHEPTGVIAQDLGRSVKTVYQRAYKLGLAKTDAYLDSPSAGRLTPGHCLSPATRYAAGHVPANKGLRRPGWASGRMRETQFKPGERRGVALRNWCPLGAIKVDRDGYQRIKVRNAQPGEATGFGNPQVWPQLHRHLWTQAHGPIPPGFALTFVNGDKSDVRLENLVLVTRAALMARNTLHNFPAPLVQTIQLLGALKRTIRRRTRDVTTHD